ncbi:unnamed protein product, partial [Tuber aestivum]
MLRVASMAMRYKQLRHEGNESGNESVVRLLLRRGADVNAQGGVCGNALQAAAYRGHESVVQLLLERGAEANAKGGHYGNALQAAKAFGHQTIVQLLITHGADPDAEVSA